MLRVVVVPARGVAHPQERFALRCAYLVVVSTHRAVMGAWRAACTREGEYVLHAGVETIMRIKVHITGIVLWYGGNAPLSTTNQPVQSVLTALFRLPRGTLKSARSPAKRTRAS